MDLMDFFSQPGIVSLCLMTVGSAVALMVMVWWMAHRRSVRRLQEQGYLPPKPETKSRQPGIWQSIVNFFTETSEEASEELSKEPPMEQPPIEMLQGDDEEPSEPAAPAQEQAPREGEPAAAERPAEDASAPTGAIAPADETQEPEAEAPPPTPEPPSPVEPPAAPPEAAPSDAIEVLRIWRDLADGSLIIDFGGQRYRHLADVHDADLHRRFVALVRALSHMTSAAPAQPTQAPAPAAGLKERIKATGHEEEEEKPPHMLRQLGRLVTGQRPTPPPPEPAGIADQIEDFLQYKLQLSEKFASRSIHIRPGPSGGVTIEVDGHFYAGVGDVVEPDVREFLQVTIQEWEARQ
jgi:hypothetical protein